MFSRVVSESFDFVALGVPIPEQIILELLECHAK